MTRSFADVRQCSPAVMTSAIRVEVVPAFDDEGRRVDDNQEDDRPPFCAGLATAAEERAQSRRLQLRLSITDLPVPLGLSSVQHATAS